MGSDNLLLILREREAEGSDMLAPAARGEASERAAGLDHILQAELQHPANTFSATSMANVQGHTDLLNLWRLAEHFEVTLQHCGSGQKLQSAA
jgi:hypothetical protein